MEDRPDTKPRHLLAATLAAADPRDVRLVAGWLHDGQTQRELAALEGVSPMTINRALHRMIQTLRGAGIEVETPGRGRRPGRPRMFSVDPGILDGSRRNDQ